MAEVVLRHHLTWADGEATCACGWNDLTPLFGYHLLSMLFELDAAVPVAVEEAAEAEPVAVVPSPVIEAASPDPEPVAPIARPAAPAKPPRAKPVAGAMPPFLRRMLDALVETNGDRDAAAAKVGIKSGSLAGSLSRLRNRPDLTDAERAALLPTRRKPRTVRVLPDGAPAPLPPADPPTGETFEERRQRVARERNAQTWRELHPDTANA